MARAPLWGTTPRASVRAECERRGEGAVVDGCLALLSGQTDLSDGPADAALLIALGGTPARAAATGGNGGPEHWLRVWAARGLLYAWDPKRADLTERVVVAALADDAWRVREMAAKVCARRRIEAAIPALGDCTADPVLRVRRAAERALVRITASD